MTKIILKFKDKVLKEIPVEKELITIGRKPDNDIEIDNLAVSGHHARIFKMEDWFLVEDLNSLNGTFVNGKMVQESPLKNGDEILDWETRFEIHLFRCFRFEGSQRQS